MSRNRTHYPDSDPSSRSVTKLQHRKLQIEQRGLNNVGELMCSRRVSSSCSTTETRRVTHIKNINQLKICFFYNLFVKYVS